MRWVLFLLALLPAMAGVGGAAGSTTLVEAASPVDPAVLVEAASPIDPAVLVDQGVVVEPTVVEPTAAIGASDGLHDAAFLPAGARLLPAGWSEGPTPPPRPCSRASHPLVGTSNPATPSRGIRAQVRSRSAAHRGLAARHALDRAGHRAFLLGTPPPLRSV